MRYILRHQTACGASIEATSFRGDFLRAPFRRSAFDSIVFAGSFYYMANPLVALRVSADLLTPGGRIVILSPATLLLAPFAPIYTAGAYERLFRQADLVFEAYERLNWAACLVRGRKP